MDRLHEELLWLEGKNVSGQQAVVEDNDEWETVGPKNRSALTRTHLSMKSQLTDIFGGQLCSIVKAKGVGFLSSFFSLIVIFETFWSMLLVVMIKDKGSSEPII